MAKIKQINVLAKLRSGKLGETILWTPRKSNYAYSRKRYNDKAPTAKQVTWRETYAKVDTVWKTLTQEDKDTWRGRIKRKAMSNYAIFMHFNLIRAGQGLPVVNCFA